tara:strand:+ start:28 stop:405 length:378 start_codon:yes stop_codon:yes gene_type:complete
MKLIAGSLVSAILAITVSVSSATAADAAKGAKVFRKCKACHSMEAGKRMIGPSLNGVFGRKAGTTEGFKYSKNMAALNVVWDDAAMSEFLQAPRKYVKGTKMAFAGLRKPADIENLLAYLKENGG